MTGARTRGHPAALAAVETMIRAFAPQGLVISGPQGVGKTTLALDLAAGLLCSDPDPGARPCRSCRACRIVDHGDHPDLHRLGPEGPGGLVGIGTDEPPRRGVRDLISELALLPVEGGARVAIIGPADRMTESAQGALLKTLEEPGPGTTIVLCAIDEARLLPTIRSRCARLRLGPVAPREVEAVLEAHGVADAPTAARLARLAHGRPGRALAYASAPEARPIQAELERVFLDLVSSGPAERLAAMRGSIPRAMALVAALDAGMASLDPPSTPSGAGPQGRGRRAGSRPVEVTRAATVRGAPQARAADAEEGERTAADDELDDEAPSRGRALPAAQRRRAADVLVSVAIDVARDLALIASGGPASMRDPDLFDETRLAAAGLPSAVVVEALRRAERASMLIAGNVNPELVLDDLALSWPRRPRAVA